ncbi:MAG TPA: GAF domain-containing protein, partial [Solirubrobacteraceae bacterium]|nr:GAF domain-containing protein [Solirubrobacteraceae bacterium]
RRFTIVAAVGAERLGLSDGVCVPQEQSFCFHMARKAAPNLSNDAGGDPVYGALPAQQVLGVGSYLGLPLETPEGRPFGSVCAMSRSPFAFTRADRRLLTVFALVLSQIVNRERSAREAAEGAAPSLAVTLGLGSPAGP